MNARDRIAHARLSGAAVRLSIGIDMDTPRAAALAELHAISTDPAVLGSALGDVLHQTETDRPDYAAAAELLRAAGASEETAAARLQWQRDRAARPAGWIRL